tara:strand:- start:3429 stop:3893 length:465 start_codon:yes stop_codon:yes gene_type:complete
MANETLGRSAVLKVVADSGTLAAIAKLTDVSFSMSAGEIDVTSFDDAGERRYVKGNTDMTCDFSFIYASNGDTAQLDVLNSFQDLNAANGANAGGILDFEYLPNGTSSGKLAGKMFVTSISLSTGEEDVQRVDVSARVSIPFTSTSDYDFNLSS